jgi:hypothetical protein
MAGKKSGGTTRTISRSSVTGRIVKPEYATNHPRTTETERVRIPPKKGK